MPGKNITYLSDLDDSLIDLDSVPSSVNGSSQNYKQKIAQESQDREQAMNPIKQKIRKNIDYSMAMNGNHMESYNGNNYQRMTDIPAEYTLGPKAKLAYGASPGHNMNYTEYTDQPPGFPPFLEAYTNSLNCIDVSNHLSNCPVCSKLYNDDYKSAYIVIIALLVIVCIVLVKKIIDGKD